MNIVAPLNFMGYGQVGRNICKSLDSLDYDFSIYPIGPCQVETEKENEILSRRHYLRRYNADSPSVKIFHQFDLLLSLPGRRFGFPIFELDNFSETELFHLRNMDGILVCSKWAKEVLKKFDIASQVVNLGYNPNIFFPNKKTQKKSITFLNIGKWEKRKGHDLLPEIFKNALPQTANYKLWMVNANPFLSQEETEQWKNYYRSILGDKVVFIERVNTQDELARIVNQADCGIFPSRAEGWNLPLMECMACGVPCIVNNYSAHTEFCNDQNSVLIDPLGMESAYDGKWFFGQGNWSVPNTVGFSNAVQYVYETLTSGRGLGVNPCVSKFTWDNAAVSFWEATH